MTFLEAAEWRYATQEYDTSKTISPEQINELKKSLQLCPSGINSQPWKFYFIQDKDIKNRLAEYSTYNGRKIVEAPLVIVFCAQQNADSLKKELESFQPEKKINVFNNMRQILGERKLKEWMTYQVYVAIGFTIAACAEMKLDSTPIEGFDAEGYAHLLSTEEYQPILAMTIGHRSPDDYNSRDRIPRVRKPLSEIIIDL